MFQRFCHIRRGLFCLIILAYVSACENPHPTNEKVEGPSIDVPTPALMPNGHLKYVAVDGSIHVYDMDNGHKLVKKIPLSEMSRPRGIAANAITDRLYIPFWGDRSNPKYGGRSLGFLLCMDLKTDHVFWIKEYEPSIDSLAITPDGQTLYMPSGEEREDSNYWFVLDGISGKEKTRIPVFKGTHNTITSLNQPRVYLASLQSRFLFLADTATNRVIKKIGPFGERVRPFTLNGRETLAFATVNFLSGFEVADVETGRVLHRVQVQGFPWIDPTLPAIQSHGVALAPDEKEVWVVDAYNRHVHVFDVTGLPHERPQQIADIDVRDDSNPGNLPKWINFSRDGRLVHVSTGAIIDAKNRTIIAKVIPSRYFIQIDMKNGEPIQAYSRYGLGYGAPGRHE
jgi:DNA-binding beta-propeller fold protein YncE